MNGDIADMEADRGKAPDAPRPNVSQMRQGPRTLPEIQAGSRPLAGEKLTEFLHVRYRLIIREEFAPDRSGVDDDDGGGDEEGDHYRIKSPFAS